MLNIIRLLACVISTLTFPMAALADDDLDRKATPVAFSVGAGPSPDYTVPVGMRLTIEYVSGACNPVSIVSGFVPPPPYPAFQVTTGGVQLNHSVAIGFNSVPYDSTRTNNEYTFFFGHTVKIYADPGTTISAVDLAKNLCLFVFSGVLTHSK